MYHRNVWVSGVSILNGPCATPSSLCNKSTAMTCANLRFCRAQTSRGVRQNPPYHGVIVTQLRHELRRSVPSSHLVSVEIPYLMQKIYGDRVADRKHRIGTWSPRRQFGCRSSRLAYFRLSCQIRPAGADPDGRRLSPSTPPGLATATPAVGICRGAYDEQHDCAGVSR